MILKETFEIYIFQGFQHIKSQRAQRTSELPDLKRMWFQKNIDGKKIYYPEVPEQFQGMRSLCSKRAHFWIQSFHQFFQLSTPCIPYQKDKRCYGTLCARRSGTPDITFVKWIKSQLEYELFFLRPPPPAAYGEHELMRAWEQGAEINYFYKLEVTIKELF